MKKAISRELVKIRGKWLHVMEVLFALRIGAFSFLNFLQFFPLVNDPSKFAGDFPELVHQMQVFSLKK